MRRTSSLLQLAGAAALWLWLPQPADGYASRMLSASRCSRSLAVGASIMGSPATADASQIPALTLSGAALSSGGAAIPPGSVLAVTFHVAGRQHVLDASLGSFSGPGASQLGCSGSRKSNRAGWLQVVFRSSSITNILIHPAVTSGTTADSATLTIPADAAAGTTIVVKAVFASRHGAVAVSQEFSLSVAAVADVACVETGNTAADCLDTCAVAAATVTTEQSGSGAACVGDYTCLAGDGACPAAR